MAKPMKWDRVEDDRGVARKRVAFGRGATWFLRGQTEVDLPPELAARLADAVQQMKAEGRGPKLSLGLAVVIILASVGAIVLLALYFPVMIGVLVALLVVGALASFFLAPPTERRNYEQSIIDTLLAEGHCASCGYAMRGLVPDIDGCTVCPECQGAWILPDVPSNEAIRQAAPVVTPAPADPRWHWLNLVVPGRRMVLSFRDARGRIQPIIDPTLVRPPAAWNDLNPDLRRRLRVRLWMRSAHWRILGIVMIGLVMVPQFLRGTAPFYSVLGPLAGAFWLFVCYIWLMTFVLPPRWGREGIVRVFVRAQVCPRCAVALSAVEPDGVVVCSGCQAAWKVPAERGWRWRIW